MTNSKIVVNTLSTNKTGMSLKEISRKTGIDTIELKAIVSQKDFFIKIPNTNNYTINRFHHGYINDNTVYNQLKGRKIKNAKGVTMSFLAIIFSLLIVLMSTIN